MTVYGLYCQWFRYFSDRMKCTQVAKVKLSVLILLFKQYGSQSQNMVFFYSVDHKRYYWYESEDPPPPPPQVLDKSCQYRKEDSKNQIMY